MIKDRKLYDCDSDEWILLSDLLNNYTEIDPLIDENRVNRRFVPKCYTEKEYSDLIMTKLNIFGRTEYIDCEISDIIQKLNEDGHYTEFCCSGHYIHNEQWFNESKNFVNPSSFINYIVYSKPANVKTIGYISFCDTELKLETIILNNPKIKVHLLKTDKESDNFYKNEYKNSDLVFYLDKCCEFCAHKTVLYWAFDPDKYSVKKVMKQLKKLLQIK